MAQEEEGKTDPDSSGAVSKVLLPTSTPILLFTAVEDKEEDKEKKKKKKKNFYFGERTKKGLIKQSFREQDQTEYFHYTRSTQEVDPYIRDIYWFDRKSRVIRNKGFDPSKGYLLHGPYEKRLNDNVVESGMYYYGTKHGRWLSFNEKNILLDKSYYYEGWPKASRVTYYNRAENQIEKLTPVEYELEDGNFYHFYENGQIAVVGEYKYGEKIGLWTEYWNKSGNQLIRKREIQYQEKPFTGDFRPYIRAEWDEEGNLIYRRDP
jgi:antitoxin component YwqK of YwqJK toxin-antitoxin module